MAYAQNEICYAYDAAGNRTQRALCCTACLTGSGAEDRSQTPAAFDTDKLVLEPNPTTGMFTLDTEGIPADAWVILLSMAGNILLQQPLGDGMFDISAYPPGSYVLHLLYGDQRKTALLEKTNR